MRRVILLLVSLLGASSSAAASSASPPSSASAPVPASASSGAKAGKGGHGAEPGPPAVLSPDFTLALTKRTTVSLADYARDPDAGPWRPDEFFAGSKRGARGGGASPPPLRVDLRSWRERRRRRQPGQAAAAKEEEQGAKEASDDDKKTKIGSIPPHAKDPKQRGPGAKVDRLRAFDAIDAFEQYYSMGEAFTEEPPDAALAVGNALVGVAVNSVLTFYRARDGAVVSDPIPAFALLGLPPPYDGAADEYGPYMPDPSLAYDPEVGRWFYTVVRIDTDPDTGEFVAGGGVELAVSASADPFEGEWSIYSLPTINDGQGGATLLVPGCDRGGGCLADYAQMRVSGDGLWLTAVVQSFFVVDQAQEDGLLGSSVYAASKFALARGLDQVAVAQWYLDEIPLPQDTGGDAYVIMPAVVADPWSTRSGGAAHFMATPRDGSRDFLLHYLLTGGEVLRDAAASGDDLAAALRLEVSRADVPANPWPLAPFDSRDVWQPQAGNFPYGQSLDEPAPGKLGGPDGRIMGLALAGGRLVATYQVLKPQKNHQRAKKHGGSGGSGSGSSNPNAPPSLFTAAAWAQFKVVIASSGDSKHGDNKHGGGGRVEYEGFGTLDAEGADVIYPNVALAANGKGAIGAGLTGRDIKPSAVVFPFSTARGGGAGKMRVSGTGKGLQDGGSQYSLDERPRWGDYSGAAVEYGPWVEGGGLGGGDSKEGGGGGNKGAKAGDEAAVWLASEYIPASCTLAEYLGETGGDDEGDDDDSACPVETCGCTRAPYANYGTRVARVVAA